MSYDAIVISGLRRSGTTALWECFRNIKGIAAYDEPFHPRLAQGIRRNPKGTWVELSSALDRFKIEPVPIQPNDEIKAEVSRGLQEYFAKLLTTEDRVVIDVVRCWNNLSKILEQQKNVLVVHLIRDPCTWVTGHLLPSGKGTWRKPFMDTWRRQTFFNRQGMFNNYHYEDIVADALEAQHPMWCAIPGEAEGLESSPAFVKLLAFWWASNLTSYQSLQAAGIESIVVTLPEFSSNPENILSKIKTKAGWNDAQLKTSHVSGTRPSFRENDLKWKAGFERAGIPVLLSDPAQVTAVSIVSAFKKALADQDSIN